MHGKVLDKFDPGGRKMSKRFDISALDLGSTPARAAGLKRKRKHKCVPVPRGDLGFVSFCRGLGEDPVRESAANSSLYSILVNGRHENSSGLMKLGTELLCAGCQGQRKRSIRIGQRPGQRRVPCVEHPLRAASFRTDWQKSAHRRVCCGGYFFHCRRDRRGQCHGKYFRRRA